MSQALDYLDNIEVSTNSEKESLGDPKSAKIYLQPPLNFNRPSSDVDFGDENTAAADTSNLSSNQLLSSAVLEIRCPSGQVILVKCKVKILRQKRLFKKQNGERKTI